MNNKGQALNLTNIPTLVIVMVVIAVVLGVGATLLSDVQDDQTVDSYAYNASQQGLIGLDTFSSWQDNIALIVVFVVILGLLGGLIFFSRR